MTDQRVAIVTGASSGIGRATAVALAGRGYAVALAARRADRLQQVADECTRAGGSGVPIVTDVTDREQVDRLVDETVDRLGRLDVMVNNAGRGLFSSVAEIPVDDLRALMELNVYGLLYGCQAAARVMVPQRSGHIFNVSSVIGKRGTPMHGAYCASKFAVNGLSDSLRVEMAPYGVRVTTVMPGLTETEFFDQYSGGGRTGGTFQRLKTKMSPEPVGRRIARTVGRNKPELIFTAGGRLLVFLSALSPRLTDAMMNVYRRKLLETDD